nr:hypothetical protein [Chlamydiota bacterium]
LFSPFGRPDSQNGNSSMQQQEPANQDSSFSGDGEQQQQEQKQFGQAKEEAPAEALADEEIPF